LADGLQSYLSRWRLSDPSLLTTTNTSHIYCVSHGGNPAVLKLLSDAGRKDESAGAAALQCFEGKGAVRLMRHDAGAHLLEYVGGEDLKSMVARGGDEVAAGIIGDVLNTLHAEPQNPEGLVPLRRWFRSLFAVASRDPLYARASAVAEKLLAENADPRVLHGDIHHENIRHSDRGWLALDPKGLYGPRLYDAANTLCNPSGMESLSENEARLLKISAILADKLGAKRGKLLAWAFSYAGLSASWSIEDRQNPSHALAIARLAELHMHI
jgi:streptomycin 6-kinase